MVAVLAGALVVPASGRPVATTGAELEVPRDAATTIAGPVFTVGFPRSTGLVAVGDVNRDGKRDLLVTNTQGHAGDQVRGNVLFGGSWPTSIRLPARGTRGFPLSGIAAASGDVNRDGYDDLVSCAMVRTSARVLFGRPGRRPPGTAASGSRAAAAARRASAMSTATASTTWSPTVLGPARSRSSSDDARLRRSI